MFKKRGTSKSTKKTGRQADGSRTFRIKQVGKTCWFDSLLFFLTHPRHKNIFDDFFEQIFVQKNKDITLLLDHAKTGSKVKSNILAENVRNKAIRQVVDFLNKKGYRDILLVLEPTGPSTNINSQNIITTGFNIFPIINEALKFINRRLVRGSTGSRNDNRLHGWVNHSNNLPRTITNTNWHWPIVTVDEKAAYPRYLNNLLNNLTTDSSLKYMCITVYYGFPVIPGYVTPDKVIVIRSIGNKTKFNKYNLIALFPYEYGKHGHVTCVVKGEDENQNHWDSFDTDIGVGIYSDLREASMACGDKIVKNNLLKPKLQTICECQTQNINNNQWCKTKKTQQLIDQIRNQNSRLRSRGHDYLFHSYCAIYQYSGTFFFKNNNII